MEAISLERSFQGDLDEVRAAMLDLEPFMEAAGFDAVTADGDEICIANHVGLLTIELDLRVVEADCLLAYEQVEGIFESMVTRYWIDAADGTVTVTAETEFALDVSLVGSILDSTIIKRQRRKELEAQFDYLEALDGVAG